MASALAPPEPIVDALDKSELYNGEDDEKAMPALTNAVTAQDQLGGDVESKLPRVSRVTLAA